MISFKEFLLERQCYKYTQETNKFPKFWKFWTKFFPYLDKYINYENIKDSLKYIAFENNIIDYENAKYSDYAQHHLNNFFKNDIYELYDIIKKVCLQLRIITYKHINMFTYDNNEYPNTLGIQTKQIYTEDDDEYWFLPKTLKIGICLQQGEYYERQPYPLFILHIIEVMIHELLHAECDIRDYTTYINKMYNIRCKHIEDKDYQYKYFARICHTGMWNNMTNDVARKYCIPLNIYDQTGCEVINSSEIINFDFNTILNAYGINAYSDWKFYKYDINTQPKEQTHYYVEVLEKDEENSKQQKDQQLKEIMSNAKELNKLGILAKQINTKTIEIAVA